MLVLKSTHARVVAEKVDLINQMADALADRQAEIDRLAGENASLRKGGPRDGRGHFVKRVHG